MRTSAWPVLVVATILAAGCGDTPEREANKAAGALIDMAATPDERAALELARDEANAEMREEAQALDEEIRRLRKENAALKEKLQRR